MPLDAQKLPLKYLVRFYNSDTPWIAENHIRHFSQPVELYLLPSMAQRESCSLLSPSAENVSNLEPLPTTSPTSHGPLPTFLEIGAGGQLGNSAQNVKESHVDPQPLSEYCYSILTSIIRCRRGC